MIKVTARELLNYTRQAILELPTDITIIFDDGFEWQTRNKSVIYTDLFWRLFRLYPDTPILGHHFVDVILKGKPLTAKTHITLLENITKSIYHTYNLRTPLDREPVLPIIYQITNEVYNEITQLAEPNVTTIDILDFTQIVDYEKVKIATSIVTGSEASIRHCYDIVTDIIKNDPYLDNNAVAIAVRSDIVSLNQVLQCVSIRGRVTEVDGTILPIPILSNFTRGLNSLYEYAAESRSAAKSQYFSDAKLQDAEYFARRIQLLSMVVEKIDYIDCGSTRTVEWRVSPPTYDDDGIKSYPGDLVFMIGKNYYDENGVMRQITHDDPNLYGKILPLRTVLYCKHPDPHKVCEVCFGGLARNVSRFANLGHLCAATMTQQTTQSVLSTKHLDKSSIGTAIILGEIASQFFTTDKKKSSYYLRGDLKDFQIKLMVSRDDAIGLVDILHIDNLDMLNPVRISQIDFIELTVRHKNEERVIPLYVSQGNKKVMMTTDFLKYLKMNRWELDLKGNFIFDLNNWDTSKPMFKLPEVEYSFSDHADMIAKVIESNMKNIGDRSQPYSPFSTLQELFNLVNTKISVNIAALEVIVYSTMITEPGSFKLGRNVEEPVLGVAHQIIKNRSLGVAFGYEDIHRQITDPRSFFKEDRCSSIFDVFLTPNEYLDYRKRKQQQ